QVFFHNCNIPPRMSHLSIPSDLNPYDVEFIEQMIRQRYDKQKEAQEYAPGYLVDLLQSHLENRISVNSEKLKAEIDTFLEKYPVPKLPNKDGIVVSIPFDTKGAFLGGVAGLGTYGALAAWAAGLGNLGSYILVAKLVSLLSALGISIGGGTATVISFVAAIGGPIVLGIGLAAGLASLVWNFFGEAWQKRLAKEIHQQFKKQGVVDKFLGGIDQYWQETATAFDKGADAVEAKCKQYLKHLHEITSTDTQSKERIEQIIINLEKLRVFFANIPWDTQGECL
ncbi:DNA-binding protein, partial [Microcoleus sp. POL10_C6]